jgi:hypothetical protein
MNAQDITTVEAKNTDISDNLDLEAVASIFSDAEDLEDFERLLNDPETRISNLDLNEDGYVDYLRVVENAKDDSHAITIQAVLGKDLYQDVATIDVEKDEKSDVRVQVVGNVYMYGPNYIIEPTYVRLPLICIWFWGPRYRAWYSPYYWDYYPSYYYYWTPYTTVVYMNYIPTYIHGHHTYHYVTSRRSNRCASLHKEQSRNAIEVQRPEKAFVLRNTGVSNRKALVERREKLSQSDARPSDITKPTGKEVKADWKPQSQEDGKPSKVKDNKVVVPKTDPATQSIKKDREAVKDPQVKPQPDKAKENREVRPTNKDVKASPKKPSIKKPRTKKPVTRSTDTKTPPQKKKDAPEGRKK